MRTSRTRIVCTVGPACADDAVLLEMLRAGADVLRINGAHVAPAEIPTWVRRIRRVARQADRKAAALVDLPGIKLRIGTFKEGPVTLVPGARIRIVAGKAGGNAERLPVHPLPDLRTVRPGSEILLDDARLRLRALRVRDGALLAVVEDGGVLSGGKGVAFPGTRLATRVPTARDRALARAAAEAGADWVGLSFVSDGEDVARLKAVLARAGARDLPVVAKIECADALTHLHAILEQADAVLVARGDLGVDIGAERVPAAQKQIIEAARLAGRPAVVATEMLESMVQRVRPTRAEASDVAGAVFEGADAVMLSAETAIGAHPVLVVETMDRILAAAEAAPGALYAGSERMPPPASLPGRPDQHVVHAAVVLARETDARAIVVFSRTGMSAIRLSKERPEARIHAFAARDAVCRRLALAWGVWPRRLPAARGTDAVVAKVLDRLRAQEGLRAGDRAVLVMGGAADPAGATTLIKLLTL